MFQMVHEDQRVNCKSAHLVSQDFTSSMDIVASYPSDQTPSVTLQRHVAQTPCVATDAASLSSCLYILMQHYDVAVYETG